MDISFLLNGETVQLTVEDPTVTVLDWLRETQGLCGTKEGCNEGDCGACTVMVSDASGNQALNSCILFLPQLNGKALRTVEGSGCRAMNCTLCSRRWSMSMDRSVGFVRPGL